MGLDNGLRIRKKNGEKIDYFPEEDLYGEEDGVQWYEVAYWRKFWSLRDGIVGELEKKYGEGYVWKLDVEDLWMIHGVIKEWIGRVLEGEKASTIWWEEEELWMLGESLKKVRELIDFFEDEVEGDYVVEFYDSY